MSSEIKRIGWHGVHGMQEDASGDYVLHSDHEAEVAHLRAEVDELRKQLSETAQCLADVSNDVGGWAVEEVIQSAMNAAMGEGE